MRRRVNPWVVVLTAALTFGSLMAFVGPRNFGYHWGPYGYYNHRGFDGHYDRYNHGDCSGRHTDRRGEQAPVRPDTNSYQ